MGVLKRAERNPYVKSNDQFMEFEETLEPPKYSQKCINLKCFTLFYKYK